VPDPKTLVAFSVVSLALVAVPGPGVLYVVARSFDQGRRAGLASMFGIQSAEVVYIFAAAVGLSAMLAASATTLSVLRYAGAAYLIFLGVRQWRSPEAPSGLPRRSQHRVFAQGFVVQMLNPKVALFFLAYFPQFLDPEAAVLPQVALLGTLYIAIACASDAGYVLAASSLRERIARRHSTRLRIRRASAATYIGLGLFAALAGDRSAATVRSR
jgi:threonine/homoserine/homoserine lactone efflux protein